MSLQGTLDTFALRDILDFLAHAQKTGALHVRGSDSGVVYLHEGQIVFASSRAAVTLGETLTLAGLIAEDMWRAVMAEAGNRPVAEVLVWAGGIDADRLRAFLQDHVEEALFEQLLWAEGEFQFRPGEAHPLGPTFAFPLDAVLAQVQTRLDLWDAIRERIPSLDVVVETLPMLPAQHREVTITADEWQLVVALDGQRTVGELARSLGHGTFHVCSTLHGLLEAGLVRRVDGGGDGDRMRPPVETVTAPAPSTNGHANGNGQGHVPAGVPADLPAQAAPVTRLPTERASAAERLAATGTAPLPNRELVRRLLAAVKQM